VILALFLAAANRAVSHGNPPLTIKPLTFLPVAQNAGLKSPMSSGIKERPTRKKTRPLAGRFAETRGFAPRSQKTLARFRRQASTQPTNNARLTIRCVAATHAADMEVWCKSPLVQNPRRHRKRITHDARAAREKGGQSRFVSEPPPAGRQSRLSPLAVCYRCALLTAGPATRRTSCRPEPARSVRRARELAGRRRCHTARWRPSGSSCPEYR
jgi:hypothetical protein